MMVGAASPPNSRSGKLPTKALSGVGGTVNAGGRSNSFTCSEVGSIYFALRGPMVKRSSQNQGGQPLPRSR
jgi:hypothetical protein